MTDMRDHFANFLILHSSAKSKAADRPEVRIFSDRNKNNFKRLTNEIKRETELINKNTNEAMLVFNQTLCIAYFFLLKGYREREPRKTLNHFRPKTEYQTETYFLPEILILSDRRKQNNPQNI